MVLKIIRKKDIMEVEFRNRIFLYIQRIRYIYQIRDCLLCGVYKYFFWVIYELKNDLYFIIISIYILEKF